MSEKSCRRCARLMVPTSSGAPGALTAALASGVHSGCLLALRAEAAAIAAAPWQARERRVHAHRLAWATRGVTGTVGRSSAVSASGVRVATAAVRVQL